MPWTKEQLDDHKKAVKFLEKIRDEVFVLLKKEKSISEYAVAQFVLGRFKKYDLISHDSPIVAFRQNTQYVHYFPSQYCKKLKPNSLILLDIWAKLKNKNSPYSDLTFMAYYGNKIPVEVEMAFNTVIKARDEVIASLQRFLKKGVIPKGREIDALARDVIKESGFDGKFLHGLGHTLGTKNAHGVNNNFNPKNNRKILDGMGYTVEPGVYFENKFGIRSEADVFVSSDKTAIITSKLQKKIYILKSSKNKH
jgi:Xaa-Pro aminopeptidase